MSALHPELRGRLEKDVIKARKLAEKGSRAAIERLGVGDAKAPSHLTDDEKKLRIGLRARSRQLGDAKRPDGSQETKRLVLEGAYEHWHQILFTRFLAENNLLVMTDGTPVTLEDCNDPEILRMESAPDGTTLAVRYASRLLPQIFRPDDPLLRLIFAPEHLQPLRKLVADLPDAIFQADDSLGWVYQFWRAEEKEAVNKSGDKIDADTLPAVTQLFTEHYMVEFLLHNTLGAWWTAKVKAAGRASAISLPYLRLNGDGSPASGVFSGWPKTVRELRVLDPCCGSGHFLVALLQLLVAMLREEEGLSVDEALRVVLSEVLHGLELDARCTQLAAFNVAFAGWRLCERPVELPAMSIACSGLSVGATREEWLAAVEDNEARFLIGQLYDLFKKAPELGSLINPARLGNIGRKASDLLPAVRGILAADPLANPDRHELGVTAKGLADAAEILGGKFHLIVTNVPYLGRGKQSEILKEHCDQLYPASKADLATSFVERGLEFCHDDGAAALVTPQNWLFLGSYKGLRERVLADTTLSFVAELGPGAFQTPLYDFSFALISICRTEPPEEYSYPAVIAADTRDVSQKAESLSISVVTPISIASSRASGDSRILTQLIGKGEPLANSGASYCGLQTGDNNRFVLLFWEQASVGNGWEFFQRTASRTQPWDGLEQILRWEQGRGSLSNEPGFRDNGSEALKRAFAARGIGFVIHRMGELPASFLIAKLVDQNGAVVIPADAKVASAIWVFLESPDYCAAVRKLDNKVGVTPATLVKVPFDLAHWQRVAAEKYPNGLPKPHTSDPTQWLFNGYPRGSDAPLQVAVARLLGYRWPRQTGSEFPDCPALGLDGLEALADEDGIVSLPPLRNEHSAAERLHALLAATYGKEWKPAVLDHLLTEAGYGGKTLEVWLRDGFFEQHCQLFQQRPFIWHIWDGQKHGFSILVNYHRLDHATLKRIIYSHLGDWINDRKREVDQGKSGSDTLHLAARQLQDKLKLVLEGESPHDIFVRWKPLEKQAVGWQPDLNDGVRLNIRPFIEADVLRKKPKIKWGVDRGKNPPGAPWGEVRDNDRHLSLGEKKK